MIHVVLVSPEIHWNTGNIGRTCLAGGAQLHLVRPLGFSLSEKEVRRAGLDYWDRVSPREWMSWEELEPNLASLGRPWFFSTKAKREMWDADLANDSVLIFGSETRGLPQSLHERFSERFLRIPQIEAGDVRSLNLSTAAGIAIYEALRQSRR
jgi:tRNA (cytidine/uridine-2'-O-)-methyltransferase